MAATGHRLAFLNRLTMAQKLLLVFLFCVLLPLSVQNVFYYSDVEDNIQRELNRRLVTSLEERAATLNGLFSGVMSMAVRYSTEERLYAMLETDYIEPISYLITYQDYFKNALQLDPTYRQIRSIMVYTDNLSVFNGATVRRLPEQERELGEDLQDITWTPLTHSTTGPFLRTAVLKPSLATTYDRSISILRYLTNYPQYGRYRKLLRIDLNAEELARVLANSELLENVLLVDADNRVLAAAHGYADTGAYPIYREDALAPGQMLLSESLKEVPLLRVLGVYDNRIFQEAFTRARLRTTAIAVSGLLAALLCIIVITRSITRRLRLMTAQANEIAGGRFVTIEEERLGNDEIALLAHSSNRMSNELRAAVEREYEARLRQSRLEQERALAKLQALQSQVDPHFMFNALESVKLKAMAKGEQETARMITYMSRMFRHLIDWDEDIIPLADDLKFLKEYLAIQQYRFGDVFAYVLQVDEEAEGCYLPKMIIQPLVENACVHGLEAVADRRSVEIQIALREEQLFVTVTDNGGGIPEARLGAMRTMLRGGEKLKGATGLYNVYQRLRLYYGEDFVLDVSSRERMGTCFYLTIPLRKERSAF